MEYSLLIMCGVQLTDNVLSTAVEYNAYLEKCVEYSLQMCRVQLTDNMWSTQIISTAYDNVWSTDNMWNTYSS